MQAPVLSTFAELFQLDETAWFEAMAELLEQRRFAELDHDNLCEVLREMSRRDRREVFSRLVVLLTHLLKWNYQPQNRTSSWRGTIRTQRRELRFLLESSTLRAYAEDMLAETYVEARDQAADESGLPVATFPAILLTSLDDLLTHPLLDDLG